MDLWLTPILVALLVFFLTSYLIANWRDNYPPGPSRLPIFGNLHQVALAGSMAKFCQKYRQIYGDVFTVKVGGLNRVVVSGYDNLQHIFIKNSDISSLKNAKVLDKVAEEQAQTTPGMVWAPYPHWKKLRSLAISTLRDEGMGKSHMEPKLLEEINCFTEHFIEPNVGQPINIMPGLTLMTHNVISQMVCAKRFDYGNMEAQRIVDAISQIYKLLAKLSLLSNIPFLGIFRRHLEVERKKLLEDVLVASFLKLAGEHRASLDAENPRDVLDRLLISGQTASDDEKHYYSDRNTAQIGLQLYGAGFESTANALLWSILYMCLNPPLQSKVQREIDDVIGVDRPVTMMDRLNLPFTDAVLLETLRRSNLAPLATPRTIEKDLIVCGKVIPAGAEILLNMASVLYDETVFEEPDKFKPERYLMGNILLKKQMTIPFNIGKRSCPGESLVKMEMFVCFVTLLQRYNLSLPQNSKATDELVGGNATHCPKPFEVIFAPR